MRIFTIRLNRILLIFFSGICILLLIIGLVPRIKSVMNTCAAEADGIPLPIIMYHSVTSNPQRAGKYAVTAEVLENDLKYLTDRGYTSVVIQDLINYVEKDMPLPEKPIMITFDDGFSNNMTNALPLLEKYGLKAVISIVGRYTDDYTESDDTNPAYSYLRWQDVRTIMAGGRIEFQNHSYDLHTISEKRSASTRKKGESAADYQKIFTSDLSLLQEEFAQHTDYTPTAFTYPFGKIDKLSVELVKSMGFSASLSCYEGVNMITKDPQCLYQLKRNNRPQKMGTADFFKRKLSIQ